MPGCRCVLLLLLSMTRAWLPPVDRRRGNGKWLRSTLETTEGSSSEWNLRFGGLGRLYTDSAGQATNHSHIALVERLRDETVAIIGIGGVGSWAAEAICRSGIGRIVLVDLDDICISNTNRQLHALSSTVGRMKTNEMMDRMLRINPHCNISIVHDFVTVNNTLEIFEQLESPSVVLDAIDGSQEKAALIAACVNGGVPIVTCGGAAGKRDPTQIVCEDLVSVSGDKLLSSTRKQLRQGYGFEKGVPLHETRVGKTRKPRRWNVDAVYSKESDKVVGVSGIGSSLRRCDSALGTACFVTGTFGFVAASRVVEILVASNRVVPNKGRGSTST